MPATEQQNGWTTVGSKKVTKDKSKPTKQTEAIRKPLATSESAFASLDNDWNQSQGTRQQNGVSSASSQNAAFRVKGNAFDSSQNAKGNANSSKQPSVAQPKKAKAPKVKKPTPAAAGAGFDVSKLQGIISKVEDKYTADEKSQLDTVADHFVTSFREAELPFNKLLAELSLEKATQIFDDAVSEEMATIMHDFVAAKDATSVADFASALMDSAFEVMPSAAGSSKSPPKANVGMLVVLALALQAKPSALLLAADHLAAGGARFSSSGRLPMLLWLLNQAARGSAATAVAVWVRVLLPQIIGISFFAVNRPVASSKNAAGSAVGHSAPPVEVSQLSHASSEKAFTYLHGLLRSSDVKLSMAAGVAAGGDQVLPIVPPSAIVVTAQAVHGIGVDVSPELKRTLGEEQDCLRSIAISGSPSAFDFGELLRSAIDAAGVSPAAEPNDPFIADMAQLTVRALEGDDATFAVWQSKHKAGLRGSSRILAALDHDYTLTSRLLAVPEKRVAFTALMPALRGRHQFALRSGKGWQGPAARKANAATVSLEMKVKGAERRKTASRSALMTFAAGLIVLLAIGMMTNDSEGGALHPLLQTAGRIAEVTGLAAVIAQAGRATAPYWQQASPYVQPVADAAVTMARQALSAVAPLIRHVSYTAYEAAVSVAGAFRSQTSIADSRGSA